MRIKSSMKDLQREFKTTPFALWTSQRPHPHNLKRTAMETFA
jgi:hypothetical protein